MVSLEELKKISEQEKEVESTKAASTVDTSTQIDEVVVKNTKTTVVPDKNDGKLAKNTTYVEYIDITNESSEDE
jgi:hypothetical protein